MNLPFEAPANVWYGLKKTDLDTMLRSLFAIIVSVIVGLAAAKFLEGGLISLQGETSNNAYALILIVSWFAGAFVAAILALLLGRRWAPLGLLAAGTIFFSAFMGLLSASLTWWVWPGAGLATAAGGLIALRALRASFEQPVNKTKQDVFPDE